MYHQLVIQPEDRPLHRYPCQILDRSKEPEMYEFIHFLFGGCYCPFCAQFTWQQHAEHKEELPLASQAVKKNCYMDDLMPSMESSVEAIETQRQLTELRDKANFHIRKWICNRCDVVEDIPEEDRATKINLEGNKLPITKTLGMLWTATDDQFLFYYSPPNEEFVYTKRNVLRCTVAIFNPLGLVAPFILLAKVMMQQAWIQGLNWDENLMGQLQQACVIKYRKFRSKSRQTKHSHSTTFCNIYSTTTRVHKLQ